MTCFGTGLRKLFFVCVIAAFGLIAVSSGFGLGILLAALALVAPYKCKIPHFLPLLLILSTLVHVIAVFGRTDTAGIRFCHAVSGSAKSSCRRFQLSASRIFLPLGISDRLCPVGSRHFARHRQHGRPSSSSTPCFYPASTA